jgi:hypothetical protein
LAEINWALANMDATPDGTIKEYSVSFITLDILGHTLTVAISAWRRANACRFYAG